MIIKFERTLEQVTVKDGIDTKNVPEYFVRMTDKFGRIDAKIKADPEMLRLFHGRNLMYRNCTKTFDAENKPTLNVGKEVSVKGW